MTTTSESLLQRIRDHADERAWNRFVEIYAPLIFRWARQSGMQSHDASDLVQDVLASVSRHIRTFRYDPSRSFRGWLRKVTINQFRMHWRRNRQRAVSPGESWLAQLPDARTLESTWDGAYRVELFRRALAAMRPDFAEKTWAAIMQWLEGGGSIEDAARSHDVSVWTLYSAKSRIIKRLKSSLDGLID